MTKIAWHLIAFWRRIDFVNLIEKLPAWFHQETCPSGWLQKTILLLLRDWSCQMGAKSDAGCSFRHAKCWFQIASNANANISHCELRLHVDHEAGLCLMDSGFQSHPRAVKYNTRRLSISIKRRASPTVTWDLYSLHRTLNCPSFSVCLKWILSCG